MMKMNCCDTKSCSAGTENQEATTSGPDPGIELRSRPKLCYYYYYSLSILVLLNLLLGVFHGAAVAATAEQQQFTSKPKTLTEPYSVTTPVLVTTPTTTTSTSTTSPTNNGPAWQSKTFKFTLTAGRFWKFNIKANSLPHTSQPQATGSDNQLRLHRNISLDNYIIDDYGWFQYNPQQQQLFAWPTLHTKPGTYYFVLLPTEIDIEAADDETSTSVANSVAANIIVELLRPVYARPDKRDIDLYLDHKFSLDYLERLWTYPLLLNQIIAVLDSLTKPLSEPSTQNNNANHQLPPAPQLSTTPNPGLATLSSYIQKITKQAPKFNEVILIHYNYSPAGNLFSLTWSTHPSILNNTITQIEDCRVSLINETVSRLSALSLGFRSYDNPAETNIYYPLDAPSLNLQAIVPTERGNYTLKLKLNGPCRNETAVEKLVQQPAPQEKIGSADDKDNDILLNTTIKLPNATSSANNYLSVTNSVPPPHLSIPSKTLSSAITAVVSESPLKFTTNSDIKTYLEDQQADNLLTTVRPHPIKSKEIAGSTYPAPTESPKLKLVDSLNPQQQQPVTSVTNVVSLKSFVTDSPTATEVITTIKSSPNGLRSHPPPFVSTPRRVAQPKSFEKFLRPDPPEFKDRSVKMANNSTEVSVIPTTLRTTAVFVTSVPTNTSLISSTTIGSPDTTDTTFNEDIMVIFDGFMDIIESITVPLMVVVGVILFITIIFAAISLFVRKRKAKHFQVKDRFSFRYGSERKGFLRTSSKPVIMEADQKMISQTSTPVHKTKKSKGQVSAGRDRGVGESNYYPMHMFLNTETQAPTGPQSTGYYATGAPHEAGSSKFNNNTHNHD